MFSEIKPNNCFVIWLYNSNIYFQQIISYSTIFCRKILEALHSIYDVNKIIHIV